MRKIKLTFTLFLLAIASVSFSQTSTISPYSKYGIGNLHPQSFLQNFALGGVGIALNSDRNINLLNPASYSDIVVTTFETALTNNALWLEDGNQKQFQNNPYIDHIAFAFPIIKKKWGMSFGMLPYSNVGYNLSGTQNDSIAGDITLLSKANGGLNRAFFGNGFNVKLKSKFDPFALLLKPFEAPKHEKIDSLTTNKKTKHYLKADSFASLSFGVNGNYTFGSTETDEKVVYGQLTNAYNLWTIKNKFVSDVNADFGMQYKKKFTKYNTKSNDDDVYQLTLGGTVALASNLSTKLTENIRTFSGSVNFGTVKDTILYVKDAQSITQLPVEYGIGFSIKKENKWLFAIDYKTANWSAIKSDNPMIIFNSNYSIATGFEFIPKYNNYQGSYFSRVTYRFGMRYSTSYFLLNNESIDEYGITFGTKLPLRRTGTSFPEISLGLEYGNRGKIENGLIKETFFNVNVGVTINDRWFQKRKYD